MADVLFLLHAVCQGEGIFLFHLFNLPLILTIIIINFKLTLAVSITLGQSDQIAELANQTNAGCNDHDVGVEFKLAGFVDYCNESFGRFYHEDDNKCPDD